MDCYDWKSTKNKDLLVQKVADRFALGQLGILPTETVYGLMCSVENSKGKERIYQIKKRERKKKLQVLISSLTSINLLNIPLTSELKLLSEKFWPGPLTIVIENSLGSEIGIRVPNHIFTLEVLKRFEKPLFSTSANLSGNTSNEDGSSNFGGFNPSPDFVVMAGKCHGTSSTVIRLRQRKIDLIRPGPIELNDLRNTLKELRSSTQ